ncbi:MAG: hypothetical protein QOE06_1952 [Thermoleophilaceae bacterium]|nr:hypothetical protein [Thermoleophilaceae bacterium]
MVLRRESDGAIAIGQPSHAWLSGQLARAWGNDAVAAPDPFEEVCLAAEQHDVGMAEWDLRPTLNRATGLPHSFMEMPLDTHLALWSAAAGRLVRQSAYAALLVSMHGTALYEMRDLDRMEPADADRVRRFFAERREEQDSLLRALGLEREDVRRNQRLIWGWDHMSLALCLDWAPTRAPGDLQMEPAGEGRVAVDPWPFGPDALTVRCEGRRLAGGYADEGEMRAALDAAEVVELEWELVPAGERPGRQP